jgi:DNA-binding CsgD family transcriptional regulator
VLRPAKRGPSIDLTANSSIKTVGIHVSHILHNLDIPTRVDSAAIAHRIASD